MSESPTSVLQPPRDRPLTAVVLGAGIAGLLSAHVACRHFERVILIDRDDLSAAAGSAMEAAKQRKGIPQYAQPHSLGCGGLYGMEELLPGFQAELLRRGGVPLDWGQDVRFFDFGAPFQRGGTALKGVGASRHLIQQALQDEVLQRNSRNLQAAGGCGAAGLLWNDDKSAVLGVELDSGESVPADLVLVASGRFCRLPQWLKAAGHAVPPVQRADARVTYSSRMYRIPADWDDKRWQGCVSFERPDGLHGAGIVPIEGRVWQVGLWGINGVVPPLEDAAYLEYARRLPDPEVHPALSRAEPITPFMKYGGANNVQRGYHKVPLPPGVVVLGDAVQALNPIYAQGMSVAAKSAVALQAALAAALHKAAPTDTEARRAAVRGMGPAFQQRLATVIDPAWMVATSEDLRYPGTVTEGVSKPPRILSAYVDAILKACHRDIKVLEIFMGVGHMVLPPYYMFHPRLLLKGGWQMVCDALASFWPSKLLHNHASATATAAES